MKAAIDLILKLPQSFSHWWLRETVYINLPATPRVEISPSHTSLLGSSQSSSSYTHCALPTELSGQDDSGLRESRYEGQKECRVGRLGDSEWNQVGHDIRNRYQFHRET